MRALAVAVLLLTAACTGSAPAGDQPPPTPMTPSTTPLDTTSYVAMGDSFTAGPLVPTTEFSGGCLRSDGNYPSLLAERLDVGTFVDASCSGADTHDLTHRQRTFAGAVLPPQIAAVDADTTLVTVGIGGNDFGLYRALVTTCLRVRVQDPGGAPCLAATGDDVLDKIDRTATRITRVLKRIRGRAPHAQVVLVGYPRIAPARGTCPERLPLATEDVAFGDRVLRRLNGGMADAARRAGVEFVDLYAASEGHSVCSQSPWVNGPVTTQSAAAFHPLPHGMRSAAEAIAAHLTR